MLIADIYQTNFKHNKPIFRANLQSEIEKYNDNESLKAKNQINKKSIMFNEYINNSSTIAVATLGRNIFTLLTDLPSQTKEQINNMKAKPQHRRVEKAYIV